MKIENEDKLFAELYFDQEGEKRIQKEGKGLLACKIESDIRPQGVQGVMTMHKDYSNLQKCPLSFVFHQYV